MKQKNARQLALLAALFVSAIAPAAWAAEGAVNINEAGAAELMLLPRVGETVAARIIEFRDQNGAFKQVEDLLLVKGIGEKTFELLRPHVSLSGPTTLSEKVRTTRESGDES